MGGEEKIEDRRKKTEYRRQEAGDRETGNRRRT
jgi:hypothetical protein